MYGRAYATRRPPSRKKLVAYSNGPSCGTRNSKVRVRVGGGGRIIERELGELGQWGAGVGRVFEGVVEVGGAVVSTTSICDIKPRM